MYSGAGIQIIISYVNAYIRHLQRTRGILRKGAMDSALVKELEKAAPGKVFLRRALKGEWE